MMISPIVPLNNSNGSSSALNELGEFADISPEEYESLQQAFCLFDRNHAGAISVPEFRKIIVSLDIATDPEKIDAIVESVDSNKDNVIDFREFATAMIRHLPPASEEEDYRSSNKRISFYDDLELIECFQAFDKNGDGFISQSELEEVMVSLGERLTPKEIRAMMEEADTNGDGLIDLEEFKQLLPM